jgi:hypothetical protein
MRIFRALTVLFIFTISLIANDYNDWLNNQFKQYNNYKKSIDDEFTDMLKSQWKEFKLFSTPTPYQKPKEKKLPIVKKEKKLPTKELKNSPIIKIKKTKSSNSTNTKEIKKNKLIQKVKIRKEFLTTNIDMFGTNIKIQYDHKTDMFLSNINKEFIGQYWSRLSKTNYKVILEQIKFYSEELNLNDWAKYQLIYKIGTKIYNDKNLANLFSWFILSKLGYDIKTGFNNNQIYLLATVSHTVYQAVFLSIEQKRYYIIEHTGYKRDMDRLTTYNGVYPKATKSLSFYINKPIKLYNDVESKILRFSYNNKQYKLDIKYSNSLVKFYKTFPQSDYKVYFDSITSPILSKSLLDQLGKIINNKTQIEAVNILLRFTQTAFRYKTDQDQFGYEKSLFPQETIHYPYSDCEDRSIMFSYLVTNLLHLNMIGVEYPNHLATAVELNSKRFGQYIKYNGKVYTISDPTYINANVGMQMPQYKNSSVKIININKKR